MPTMEQLATRWQALGTLREKDRAVAQALGGELLGDERVRFGQQEMDLPHYTSELGAASRAMDLAWSMMEESAPLRISCSVSRRGREGQECHVEWWPEDGTHMVTPEFASEAESRAFAVFAFASKEGSVE